VMWCSAIFLKRSLLPQTKVSKLFAMEFP
jgi:hypothetical protein